MSQCCQAGHHEPSSGGALFNHSSGDSLAVALDQVSRRCRRRGGTGPLTMPAVWPPPGRRKGESGLRDRESVVEGKRGDLGGRRIIKKKKNKNTCENGTEHKQVQTMRLKYACIRWLVRLIGLELALATRMCPSIGSDDKVMSLHDRYL